jgi:Mn-dependent DtxR family transcriptional regulator
MNTTLSHKSLAAHVIQTMIAAQKEGDRVTLDGLAEQLRVRRGDVRSTLTRLHQQGLIDVSKMRLTMQGFAIGLALEGKPLAALRPAAAGARVAAA